MDDRDIGTPEKAIEILAERLHWKMEHLDPGEYAAWSEMDDHDKEFFRQCVKALLQDGPAMRKAFEW